MARDKLMEKFDGATRSYDTAGFKPAFAAFDEGDYWPLVTLLRQPLRPAGASA